MQDVAIHEDDFVEEPLSHNGKLGRPQIYRILLFCLCCCRQNRPPYRERSGIPRCNCCNFAVFYVYDGCARIYILSATQAWSCWNINGGGVGHLRNHAVPKHNLESRVDNF